VICRVYFEGRIAQKTYAVCRKESIWVDEWGNSIAAVRCVVDALWKLRDLGFELVVVDNAATGPRTGTIFAACASLHVRPLLNRGVDRAGGGARGPAAQSRGDVVTGRSRKDHKTIADFRKKSGPQASGRLSAIRRVCRQMVSDKEGCHRTQQVHGRE